MHKRIEDFSMSELIERKAIQETLHVAVQALKTSLDEHRYNDAVYLNIHGSRTLRQMVERNLAIDEEVEMLDTLRSNVANILRLQGRWQ
jgi:tRNA C32,U32 (ribose-2'-O)-methylase TrmJ